MIMDLDSPFSLTGIADECKSRPPMASPPTDTISLASPPFEIIEHPYHSWNLERKRRLEHQLLPLEKCVRGGGGDGIPPLTYFSPEFESFPGHNNIPAAYHLPRAFGKEANFYGGAVVVPSDFDYPSPFGVAAADLSSISETDRSPSPQALGHHGYVDMRAVDVEGMNTSYPRVWDGDSPGYGAVIPRDVQHVHESTYPEPEQLVRQKVSQIYDPCASLYHTQGEILSDLEITDDVDADCEPDAMCHRDIDSVPTQRASKMPRTKKPMRNHQGSASSGVRKRGAASRRASGPNSSNSNSSNNNNNNSSNNNSKEPSAEARTYVCSFKAYGCESTFASKNEWKRHFSSQHLKLHFYRCDLDGCLQSNKGPNDFNRKDLFTQHLRRMHAPWTGRATVPTPEEKARFDESLDVYHERCLKEQRRPPPLSRCVVCNKAFELWQERMEHMSKHYEEDPRFIEPEDRDLVQWALQEGILCRKGASSNEFVLTDKRERDRKLIS